ncbi:MAG: metallopeptidase family protein [Chloroflexi bacterium]|nr:metallopeptidase family protein [Chloroflexota bacterium]MDA1146840.1 metallopeptidase family protein [Chloroflexota bacterium]MQC82452.1 metallopeptidase family protein [Chloroflexota bacterium]
MDRDRFRRLVQRALRGLPVAARDQLNNLEVVIEREPGPDDLESSDPGDTLFGLYIGTPLVDRADYHLTLPDRIVIFQGPLERSFHPRDIPEQVRITVLHEIAHHFGIDDDRLHQLGYR